MTLAPEDLSGILAIACERSGERAERARGSASAFLEGARSGAFSRSRKCVLCGRSGPLEAHHIAGRRHGEQVIKVCPQCHQRLTERQDLWDPRWQSAGRSSPLDLSFLLRGYIDILEERSRFVAEPGAYLSLATSLREQYVRIGRTTL